MNADVGLIDFHILKITPAIINMIKKECNLEGCEYSIFRPKKDLAMLLFKETCKSSSIYTLNLLTLKPTANSPNKTLLSSDIIAMF